MRRRRPGCPGPVDDRVRNEPPRAAGAPHDAWPVRRANRGAAAVVHRHARRHRQTLSTSPSTRARTARTNSRSRAVTGHRTSASLCPGSPVSSRRGEGRRGTRFRRVFCVHVADCRAVQSPTEPTSHHSSVRSGSAADVLTVRTAATANSFDLQVLPQPSRLIRDNGLV